MKTAIIYYSLEGNTKEAARKIAGELNADTYELKMQKNIPADSDSKFVKGGFQAVFGICPSLEDFSFDEKKYDRIIIGTPVWAGKPASPVNTLMRFIKEKNKITAVFCSSGSGNDKKCIAYLKKKCPDIRFTASLADRNNKELSSDNGERLNEFIKKLNGENTNG